MLILEFPQGFARSYTGVEVEHGPAASVGNFHSLLVELLLLPLVFLLLDFLLKCQVVLMRDIHDVLLLFLGLDFIPELSCVIKLLVFSVLIPEHSLAVLH